MKDDYELFTGMKLSGLFKDIYNNQKNKKVQISQLIADIRKLVVNANDILTIGPTLKDLIDTSVRNDDSLIKMATIAQRIVATNVKSTGDSGILTDKEKENLLKEFDETMKTAADANDARVDDLTFDVEELKQKTESK